MQDNDIDKLRDYAIMMYLEQTIDLNESLILSQTM